MCNRKLISRFIGAVSLGLIVACASSGERVVAEGDAHEPFNRAMHGFNDGVNDYVASPIVELYQWVFPDFARLGVANFFTNLKEPRTVANDILQGKPNAAGDDFERFLINTFLGFGGIVNTAGYADIDYHEEDFTQTLAVWGVPRGEYLVLPFLGPSSYRAIPGELVDAASSPVSYVNFPIQVLGLLNARSNADQSLKIINEAALDPYIFMRDSYTQWRKHQITEGVLSDESLLELDFEDSIDDEELELFDKNLNINLD